MTNNTKTVYITTSSENPTKTNLMAILMYAFCISAALSFNDFVLTIFSRYKLKGVNEILSKGVYVVLMFAGALSLAYYSKTTVPI